MKKLISIITISIVTMVSPIVASTTPTCNNTHFDKDKGYEPIKFSEQATTSTLHKTLRFEHNQQDCINKLSISLKEMGMLSKNDTMYMSKLCETWLSKDITKIDIKLKTTNDPINKMTLKELDYL